MSAPAILDEAAAVLQARAGAYGPPATSMAAIAGRWSVTLGRPARLAHDPAHRDSVVDVIGYAALLPEVRG